MPSPLAPHTSPYLASLLCSVASAEPFASPPDAIARTGNSEIPIRRHKAAVLSALESSSSPVKAAAALLEQRLGLTPRQAEVLHWVAEGKTNSEISIILACSFFTVKAHLKEIFQRLSVHSRMAAAACAYRAHIAEADAIRASLKQAIPQPKPSRRLRA